MFRCLRTAAKRRFLSAASLLASCLIASTFVTGCSDVSPSADDFEEQTRQLVRLIEERDSEGLIRKISYATILCGSVAAVPCRGGEAPGTLVEGFPMGGCEPFIVRRDAVPMALAAMLADVARVFAVYYEPELGPGGFVAVFQRERPESGLAVTIAEGRVSSVSSGCGAPRDLVAGAGPFLIAPPE